MILVLLSYPRILRNKKILLLIPIVFSISFILAQPTFESFAISETGNTGSTDLDAKPAGVIEGDLLISVACYESGSSQTVTSPVGWSLIAKIDEGSNIGIASFYKIADAADVAAPTFTFSLSEDKKWTLGVSRISNVDVNSPINIFSESSGTGGSAIAASVTTSVDSCLILAIYGNKKDATYVGSFNEEYEIEHEDGQIASQMLETFVQLSTGSTGNSTAIPSNAESWIAQQIAIRKSDGVVLLNNFRSITTGIYYINTTWEREQSNGTWLNPSNIPPQSNSNVFVRNTHVVTANNGVALLDCQVTMESGGALNIQN